MTDDENWGHCAMMFWPNTSFQQNPTCGGCDPLNSDR